MRATALAVALAGCSLVNPSGITEEVAGQGVCADLVDQDLDGRFDCADEDCADDPRCPTPGSVHPPRLPNICSRGWSPWDWSPFDSVPDPLGTCAPWAREAARSEECGVDLQVPFGAGSVACEPVGADGSDDACALPFPQPEGLVLLRPGATDGDGTYERPYGSLARALDDPDADAVLLDGSLVDPVILTGRPTLRGRCPTRARLGGGVRLEGEGPALRDVWIETAGEALSIGATGARVETSIVEGAVRVEGTASLVDTRVRGPLTAEGTAQVELIGVQLDAEDDRCIAAAGDATLVATDTVLSRCPVGAIHVSEGALVEIEHCVLDELVGAPLDDPEPDAILLECDPDREDACFRMRNSILRPGPDDARTLVGLHLRSGRASIDQSAFPQMRGIPWQRDGRLPEPPRGRALWVEGGFLEVGDAVIHGLQTEGLTDRGRVPDVLVQIDGGVLDVHTTWVRSFARVGVDVRGGTLTGNDLLVDNLIVPTRETNGGIRALAGSALRLRTFEVRDTEPCAFWLEEDVSLLITSGVINEMFSGFCIPDAAGYPSSIFSTGMTHVSVSQPVRRR